MTETKYRTLIYDLFLVMRCTIDILQNLLQEVDGSLSEQLESSIKYMDDQINLTLTKLDEAN